jgi:hypothetical protein
VNYHDDPYLSNFLHHSLTPIALSILLSSTFFQVRDQVAHPYKKNILYFNLSAFRRQMERRKSMERRVANKTKRMAKQFNYSPGQALRVPDFMTICI